MKRQFLLPSLALAAMAPAMAQGDNCTSPTVIDSFQVVDFSNTSLTDSGFGVGGCGWGVNMAQDAFFVWTPEISGQFYISAEGSTFDTTLRLYEGTDCSAVCVDFNDDDLPGATARITYSVTAGQPYLIQLGGYPGSNQSGQARLSLLWDCANNPGYMDPTTAFPTGACSQTELPAGFFENVSYGLGGTAKSFSTVVPGGATLMVDANPLTPFSFYSFDEFPSCSAGAFGLSQVNWTNTTGSPVDFRFDLYIFGTPNCSFFDLDIQLDTDAPCGEPDDDLEDNDDCSTAENLDSGYYPGLFVSKTDKDYYTFCVDSGDTLAADAFFTNDVADIDLFLWDDASGCMGSPLVDSLSTNNDESLSWTNTTGGEITIILEVQVWDSSATQDCNYYDLQLSGAKSCSLVGFTFCDPANPNSTGLPTVLSGTYGSSPGSGLHLEATQGPPNQFGYFLVGLGSSEPGLSVSQGRLCLDPSQAIGRYNIAGTALQSLGSFGSNGVFDNLSATSTSGTGFDVPSQLQANVGTTIMAGETYHYQVWHREDGGNSNFSNGFSFTF